MLVNAQVRSERAKAEMPPRRKKGESIPIAAPPKVFLCSASLRALVHSYHCDPNELRQMRHLGRRNVTYKAYKQLTAAACALLQYAETLQPCQPSALLPPLAYDGHVQ